MGLRAKMTPEVQAQILEIYETTLSVRETGRRLNVHENSVRLVLKASKGQCSDCPTPIRLGSRYCDDCKARRNAWQKARVKERQRQGLCAACDERIAPPSMQYCDTHRIGHLDASQRYRDQVNRKREVPGAGIPEAQQRDKALRYSYGPAGVEAYQRDRGRCQICNVAHAERAVHVHHLDEDPTHNVVSNLVCLCRRCHHLVHRLVDHPMPIAALRWINKHYPNALRKARDLPRTAAQLALL